jgi:hypothetical protein
MSAAAAQAAKILRNWIQDRGLTVPGLDEGEGTVLVFRIGSTTALTLTAMPDGWFVTPLAGPVYELSDPIASLNSSPESVLRAFYLDLGNTAFEHRRADRRKLAFTLGDFAAESAFSLQFEDVGSSIEDRGLTSYR